MKTLYLALILLLCTAFSSAQKYEAAALYSHVYMVPGTVDGAFGFNGDALHFNGGGGSFTYNAWRKTVGGEGFLIGPKLEVLSFVGTRGGTLTTYLVGPQVKLLVENRYGLRPFIHALFGAGNGQDHAGFVTALGGGLDVQLKEHFALRPAQIDYQYSHIAGPQDSVRYSAGIVLTFGK